MLKKLYMLKEILNACKDIMMIIITPKMAAVGQHCGGVVFHNSINGISNAMWMNRLTVPNQLGGNKTQSAATRTYYMSSMASKNSSRGRPQFKEAYLEPNSSEKKASFACHSSVFYSIP